jgi:hypothetical protein
LTTIVGRTSLTLLGASSTGTISACIAVSAAGAKVAGWNS